MEIKLNELRLENFQGIKQLNIKPKGNDITIRGQNGAGKTTTFNAFLWLLFDKDSQGKTDFAIKRLDATGQELHNLVHSVEGAMEIDGKEVVLKKEFKEKWTKKRGESQRTFTGHTTNYMIDQVPLKKKEWDLRTGEIIDEDTFKLLTSPTYFNSLHWEIRRQILLQVCGDVLDEDVISSDILLADLPEILSARSMEDHKKVVAGQKKAINDRLKEIPSRIDELTKTLTEVPTEDKASIEAEISRIETEIKSMAEDTAGAELRKRKAELETQLAEARTALSEAKRQAVDELTEKLDGLKQKEADTKTDLNNALIDLNANDSLIGRNIKEMARLREEYRNVQGQEFEAGELTCPQCGHDFLKEENEKRREDFNTKRAARLADINKEGKALKKENEERLVPNSQRLQKKKEDLESLITSIGAALEETEALRNHASETAGKEIKANIAKLETDIEEITGPINLIQPPDTSTLESQVRLERAKIAKIDAVESTRQRIVDLGQEEKDLAAEYEELERQTSLLERFEMTRATMLESKVGDKFQVVSFKLFHQNINGGIEPCCVTTVGGVPWDSVNTGGQLHGGLDIVSTLQKHYGISAPCWLDHREALVEVPETDFQLISLVVDGNYPELHVE